MLRPKYCPHGHELLWLTRHVAVCNACDEEAFIYRYEGYLKRVARFFAQKLRPGTRPGRIALPQAV
jgi:hypothetical protein